MIRRILAALLLLHMGLSEAWAAEGPSAPVGVLSLAGRHGSLSLSDIGASGLTVQQPDVGAIVRNRDAKIQERVALTDFCAIGQSPTSGNAAANSACLQLAAQRMCGRTANGVTQIDLPAYDIPISAAVTVSAPCDGIYFKGRVWGDRDQPHGTRFLVTGAGTQSLFSWAPAVRAGDRYFYGGGISDALVKYDNSALAQTGQFADISKCYGCIVDNLFLFNPYRALAIHAGYLNVSRHVFVSQMALGGEAIRFDGYDQGSSTCGSAGIGNCPTRGDVAIFDDIHVDSVLATIGSPAGTCFRVSNFAETTWISRSTCQLAAIALNVDCPDSHVIDACPQFVYLDRFEAEVNATGGSAGSAVIAASDFVHFEAHSLHAFGYGSPANLVKFSSARFAQAGDVQVYGGKVENAGGPCILSSIRGLTWIGGAVRGCGPAGDGTAYAFDLRPNSIGGAAASGSVIIQGVRLCNNVEAAASTSMKAVLLEAGTDWNVVSGNVVRDCQASPINDQSGGTHNVLTPNAGP